MKRSVLIGGLFCFCIFGRVAVAFSEEKDSISIWLPETKIIVTDSNEVFVAEQQEPFLLNDTIECISSIFRVPICGYAAIAMYYDNRGMTEGQELRRTYDEVVRIYKTSRKYTEAEEREITRVVIEHMRHKRLWVKYLSPFNTGTYIVRVVRFDIKV